MTAFIKSLLLLHTISNLFKCLEAAATTLTSISIVNTADILTAITPVISTASQVGSDGTTTYLVIPEVVAAKTSTTSTSYSQSRGATATSLLTSTVSTSTINSDTILYNTIIIYVVPLTTTLADPTAITFTTTYDFCPTCDVVTSIATESVEIYTTYTFWTGTTASTYSTFTTSTSGTHITTYYVETPEFKGTATVTTGWTGTYVTTYSTGVTTITGPNGYETVSTTYYVETPEFNGTATVTTGWTGTYVTTYSTGVTTITGSNGYETVSTTYYVETPSILSNKTAFTIPQVVSKSSTLLNITTVAPIVTNTSIVITPDISSSLATTISVNNTSILPISKSVSTLYSTLSNHFNTSLSATKSFSNNNTSTISTIIPIINSSTIATTSATSLTLSSSVTLGNNSIVTALVKSTKSVAVTIPTVSSSLYPNTNASTSYLVTTTSTSSTINNTISICKSNTCVTSVVLSEIASGRNSSSVKTLPVITTSLQSLLATSTTATSFSQNEDSYLSTGILTSPSSSSIILTSISTYADNGSKNYQASVFTAVVLLLLSIV